MNFSKSQYDQIATAVLALPDTDQKANLVHILTCNFLVCAPDSFEQFKFIQGCYVKRPKDTNITSLEAHLDKRFSIR